MDSRLKKSIRRGLLFGAGLAAAIASAATFNLFSPATGILKGNSSTYVTTAAASTDVVGLFTGCSGVQYLGADGACHTAGAGTVTSVGSGTGLTGGPITGSGSLALSVPVTAANGGTGETGTITGVIKGNGTSAHTAAVAADVVGLFSTCSGVQYLGADGACHNAGGGSGTVTSITSGTGITLSPSTITTTGSVAVNQGTNFAWTGNQTFAPLAGLPMAITAGASANGITVQGANGFYTGIFTGGSGTGQSAGVRILAGTNSSDKAFWVTNQSGATDYFQVAGNGGTVVGSPTGGNQGLGSLNAQAVYVQGTAVPKFGILCTVNISLAGTGSPSVGGNHGCTSPGVSRSGVGVYVLTDATISSAFGAYCSLNSSTPFFFIIGTTSSVTVDIYSPGGTLGDPPSGATLVCMWGG